MDYTPYYETMRSTSLLRGLSDAELDTLNEQIAQQKTENEEMQRILSGDADQITEWVARDSYNYAAPNERIFVDVTGN